MKTQENLVLLAPMEGVVDGLMRAILTSINHYDMCITEFIRVVDRLVPKHSFLKLCPELNTNGKTASGTPIRVQLLGQEPNWMAENALQAIELGSHGVDINFGCPAKAVNKSKGGAVLLKNPESIFKIVNQVKQSVGQNIEVSAKIRLGFEDESLFKENVAAVAAAGANLLTIHARTKTQGYKPPAYWPYIGSIANDTSLPIVANGEIWNQQDALQCINESKTSNIMLGRGALALPNLANVIKKNETPLVWPELTELLITYSNLELLGDKSFYYSSRIKQWLRYLRLQYPEAELLFQAIKMLKSKNEIFDAIEFHRNISL